MLKDGIDAEGFAVGDRRRLENCLDKKTVGDFPGFYLLRVEELKSL